MALTFVAGVVTAVNEFVLKHDALLWLLDWIGFGRRTAPALCARFFLYGGGRLRLLCTATASAHDRFAVFDRRLTTI